MKEMEQWVLAFRCGKRLTQSDDGNGIFFGKCCLVHRESAGIRACENSSDCYSFWLMFTKNAWTQTRLKWGIVIGVIGFMSCGLMAQAPDTPQFDPSDVYFQAYLAVRNGETLEKEGDFVGALKKVPTSR